MPSLSRIFGWTPSKSEEHVNHDIPPCSTPPGNSPLSIFTSNFKSVGKGQSPAGSEVASPFSSTSSLPLDGGPQLEPGPLRRGDPAWVARPRNPFIIFRCEYSREHSKEGKRVRRLPGSQVEKTLSKRAAEAWHQLSAEEKNRFKKLADEEREEHARRHPNYRFRPKRNTGKKRLVHVPKLQPQPPKLSTAETIVAPIPRYPSPPNTSKSSSSSPLVPYYAPPPENMSMVKATRRRSASAPSLPFMQPQFAGLFDTEMPRLKVKRSRSSMVNRTLSIQTGQASSYEDLSFDPRLFDLCDFSGEYNIPDSLSSEIGSVELPFDDQFSDFGSPGPLSPLSAVTSSLTSWTGEPDIVGNQLAPACSPWSSSPAVGINGEPLDQYTEYQSMDTGLATAAGGNYVSTNLPWTTSSSDFPAATNINVTSVTELGALYTPMAYDQAEHTYVLQEYGLGLDMRVGDTLTMGEEDPVLGPLGGNSYF